MQPCLWPRSSSNRGAGTSTATRDAFLRLVDVHLERSNLAAASAAAKDYLDRRAAMSAPHLRCTRRPHPDHASRATSRGGPRRCGAGGRGRKVDEDVGEPGGRSREDLVPGPRAPRAGWRVEPGGTHGRRHWLHCPIRLFRTRPWGRWPYAPAPSTRSSRGVAHRCESAEPSTIRSAMRERGSAWGPHSPPRANMSALARPWVDSSDGGRARPAAR